jgi:hypothetical protein
MLKRMTIRQGLGKAVCFAMRSLSGSPSVVLVASLALALDHASAYAAATSVSVSGRKLIVEGQPFSVRGAAYNSTPVGQGGGYSWWADATQTYRQDFPLLKRMNANAIRTYSPVNNDLVVDSAAAHGLYVIMGFVPPAGSDWSNAATQTSLRRQLKNMMRRHRENPAILFWYFGNEEDLDGFSLPAWYSLLNAAAGDLKAEDNHPVATCEAEINDIGSGANGSTDGSMTNLDIWGSNIYRGPSFTTAFSSYAALSSKPLWISEHGADAYNVPSVAEDQAMQKGVLLAQYGELLKNTSAESAAAVSLGHTLFEFLDEWWKAGNNAVHDNSTAFTAAGYPDPNMNEEWWGVVAVDAGGVNRTTRLGYHQVRDSQAIWSPATKLRILARGRVAAGDTMLVTVWATDDSGRIDRSKTGNATLTLTELGTKSANSARTGATTLAFDSGIAFTWMVDTELEQVRIDATSAGLTAAATQTVTIGDLDLYTNTYGEGRQGTWQYAAGSGDAITIDHRNSDIAAPEGDMLLKAAFTRGGGWSLCWLEDASMPLNSVPFDTFTFMARSSVAPVTFTVRAIESTYGAGDIAEKNLTITTADSWYRFNLRKSDFTINSGAGGNGVMLWNNLVQSVAFVTPSVSATMYFDDIRWMGDSTATSVIIDTPVLRTLSFSSDTPARFFARSNLDTSSSGDTVWFAGETQTITMTVAFTSATPDSLQVAPVFDSGVQIDLDSPYRGFLHIRVGHATGDTFVNVMVFDSSGPADTTRIRFRPDTVAPDSVRLIRPVGGAFDTTRPTFAWTRSSDSGAGVARYRLEVSGNAAFSSLITSETTAHPDTDVTLSVSLAESVYYWRVLAYDSVSNFRAAGAQTESFVIDTGGPVAFALRSPPHRTETSATTILFSWDTTSDAVSGLKEYRLVAARTAAFASLVLDSSTALASSASATLAGSDTYYWRVIAVDNAGNTRASSIDSTIVVDTAGPNAAVLSAPANFHETSATAITFSWTAATDTISGLASQRLQIDTAGSFASPFVDSAVGLGSSAARTLSANDTYFWRILATDDVGNTTASSSSRILLDTLAPTAPPLVNPTAAETTSSPVPFDWSASADTQSGIAGYRLQVDTAGTFLSLILDRFQPLPDSTLTLNADTYFWRVLALDDAGNTRSSVTESFVVTGTVDSTPPGVFALTAPSHGAETREVSITFRWATAADSSLPIIYRLIVDTDFVGIAPVDTTLLGTSATVILPANDTWLWRVIATDNAGNTRASGDSRVAVDTAPPAKPALVNPTAGETSFPSIAFDWSASTDSIAGLAGYRLQVCTAASFSGGFVLNGLQATPDSTVTLGVDTYYWRVIVVDDLGNTDTSATESFAVVSPPDTAPPVAFALNAPATATETREVNVTFRWADALDSSLPLSYQLLVDTDFSGALVASASLTETFATLSLPPNDTYLWRVIATDLAGNTTAVGDSRIVVDTAGPSAPSLVSPIGFAVVTTNVFLQWTASTDSIAGFRRYRLQLDTAGTFTGVLGVDSYALGVDTIVTLVPDTWFWRVIAEDDLGNTTATSAETFVVSGLDTTPPIVLGSSATPSPVNNAGSTTVTLAVLLADSSPIDTVTVNLTPLGGTDSSLMTFVTDSLWTRAVIVDSPIAADTYDLVIRFFDIGGNSGTTTVRVIVVDTSPTVATIVETPIATFRLAGERISIVSTLSDTLVRVVYEVRTAGDSWVRAAGIGNPDTTGPFWGFYWDVSGLAAGTYDLRAVATGPGGVVDTNPGFTRVVISASGGADSTLHEYRDPTTGLATRRQLVRPESSVSILIADGGTAITVPRGAVTETCWIRVVSLETHSAATPVGSIFQVPGAGVFRTFTREDGKTTFASPITIELPYPDTDALADNVGLTGVKEASLAIYFWDETLKAWIRVSTSVVDASANVVRATVTHFTTFAVLAGTPAAANLSGVVVYPNPYIPSDGIDANGREFTAGDPLSGILFDGLPAQVDIVVYDLAGRRVASMSKSADEARYQWDGRSADGTLVASGVYMAVIRSGSGERVIRKIMVIR